MPAQYTEIVVRTLARQLGVTTREIDLAHDLYRDWGLTPLALVVVLLDLERSVAIELPAEELSEVRTVADLARKFRAWVHAEEIASVILTLNGARNSVTARNERRLRRELHHLRWLEQNAQRRSARIARRVGTRAAGAALRVAGR
ncbi:MAG TPA: phosphopantetheine-binding protein [Polyangiaceae bacterium]